MSRIPLNIVGGANFGRYGKISQENTYNMFVTDKALVPFLGYKNVKRIAGKESRGLFFSPIDNLMIHVIDDAVYKVDVQLNYSLIGNILTSSGIVYIAANNASPSQFGICDLSNIYVFSATSDITVIPNLGFLPCYIDFQDGYLVSGDRLTNLWYLSHNNDGTDWTFEDPGDGVTYQGALETKPDTIQATVAFNRILLVMGHNVTEIWQDVGNALFPYQRVNYYSIDYGVVSTATIAEGFGYVVWLAKNEYSSPTIMVTTGTQPNPISTDGINFVLDKIQYPERSSAFIFRNSVHVFYQLTFHHPDDNLTLLYDFTTGLFFTLTDENMDFHIAKRFCHFNNKNYFIAYGNAENGYVNLYEMSSDYTTYDGKTIPRFRICSPDRKSSTEQFLIQNVHITMEQGATNQLQRVGLSMSKNGGLSFGNIVMNDCNNISYGKNKMQWWKLGSANDVSFKFQFWSGDKEVEIRTEDGNLNERFVIIDAEAIIQ